VILEAEQPIFEFAERRKIVGCKNLSLDDREVDLGLVQPTGMDGGGHQGERRPLGAEASGSPLTGMNGAIGRDPEDAAGGTIRLLIHDLSDPAIERSDAAFQFAAAKDLGPPNVPSGQIGPIPLSLILMFDVLGTVQGGGPGGVGLKAGLLVSAHHKVGCTQGHSFPDALVEIEDSPGLLDKGGVTGKNPTAETPRTQGVAAQPAPKRGAANLGHDALGQDFPADLGQGEAGQREASPRGKFAGQGLNLDHDAGGKAGWPPAPRFLLKARQAGQAEALAPLADDLPGRTQAGADEIVR